MTHGPEVSTTCVRCKMEALPSVHEENQQKVEPSPTSSMEKPSVPQDEYSYDDVL